MTSYPVTLPYTAPARCLSAQLTSGRGGSRSLTSSASPVIQRRPLLFISLAPLAALFPPYKIAFHIPIPNTSCLLTSPRCRCRRPHTRAFFSPKSTIKERRTSRSVLSRHVVPNPPDPLTPDNNEASPCQPGPRTHPPTALSPREHADFLLFLFSKGPVQRRVHSIVNIKSFRCLSLALDDAPLLPQLTPASFTTSHQEHRDPSEISVGFERGNIESLEIPHSLPAPELQNGRLYQFSLG